METCGWEPAGSLTSDRSSARVMWFMGGLCDADVAEFGRISEWGYRQKHTPCRSSNVAPGRGSQRYLPSRSMITTLPACAGQRPGVRIRTLRAPARTRPVYGTRVMSGPNRPPRRWRVASCGRESAAFTRSDQHSGCTRVRATAPEHKLLVSVEHPDGMNLKLCRAHRVAEQGDV